MKSLKYSLLENDCKTVNRKKVYRLQALRDIEGVVEKGEIGGYVGGERNLSHEGRCWVRGDASVMGWSIVSEDAQVSDNAKVYGHAKVIGRASVYNNAEVSGRATIKDDASVFQRAVVYGDAVVSGSSAVYDEACVMEMAKVADDARVFGRAVLCGDATASGDGRIFGSTVISRGNISSGIFNHDMIQAMSNTLRLDIAPTIEGELGEMGKVIKKDGGIPKDWIDELKSRLVGHHRSVEGYRRFLIEELETIDGLLETYRMFIDENIQDKARK